MKNDIYNLLHSNFSGNKNKVEFFFSRLIVERKSKYCPNYLNWFKELIDPCAWTESS